MTAEAISNKPIYNDEIVKLFTLATLFWAIAGFTIGLFIALQMAFPQLNFPPYLTFGRLRPLHTSAGIFAFGGNASVYYLPGTTGWTSTFGGWPTALWNPQLHTPDPGSGIRTNGFGLTLTGTTNLPVVVEACTNLDGVWTSLFTGTLTNGSIYFSDPQWTNYPGRFYRVRSP